MRPRALALLAALLLGCLAAAGHALDPGQLKYTNKAVEVFNSASRAAMTNGQSSFGPVRVTAAMHRFGGGSSRSPIPSPRAPAAGRACRASPRPGLKLQLRRPP